MKKFIAISAALLLAGSAAVAQPRAIGLRLGYGASVTYQHYYSDNILSFDLDAFGFEGIGATVTRDWLNPFGKSISWNGRGNWNWYLGAGASAGVIPFAVHEVSGIKDYNTNVYVGATGRCGVEYEFWFPLQLALEYRPTLSICFNNYRQVEAATGRVNSRSVNVGFFSGGLIANAITLCVRYKF